MATNRDWTREDCERFAQMLRLPNGNTIVCQTFGIKPESLAGTKASIGKRQRLLADMGATQVPQEVRGAKPKDKGLRVSDVQAVRDRVAAEIAAAYAAPAPIEATSPIEALAPTVIVGAEHMSKRSLAKAK